MIDIFADLWMTIFATIRLSTAMQGYAAHWTDAQRFEYAYYIVRETRANKIDEYMVAAVIWEESDWTNLPVNATNDYGYMQVHWQPGERWLDGLTRADLMDPAINIRAGVAELAHMRVFCQGRDKDPAHHWIGHFRFGVVVPSDRYGKAIQRHRDQLINNRNLRENQERATRRRGRSYRGENES